MYEIFISYLNNRKDLEGLDVPWAAAIKSGLDGGLRFGLLALGGMAGEW